jgi:hypothetical protein
MAKTTITKKKKTPLETTVFHAEHHDGIHHIVGIGNIRVLLIPEGSGWFAQGLEIDYAVQGDSLEGVKKEFEDGLTATVLEHLKIHDDISIMLKPAPNEFWDLANDPQVQLRRYSQVTHHHVIKENSKYEGISYLIANATNVAA